MLKAVIDTNIWVSALLKSPLTRPILEAFIKEEFTPILSNELLQELNDTLNKPEIARLIKTDEAKELIALIAEKSKRVEPAVMLKIYRDPEDNFILALSKASGAPLVTLDKDFLILSEKFNVISPRQFLRRLNK